MADRAGVAHTVTTASVGETELQAALVDWTASQRPAWVDAAWFEARIRPEVRRLLMLQPGFELGVALAAVAPGRCPIDHTADRLLDLPVPDTAAGFPCLCRVIVAAGWEAQAAWTQVQAASALVAAAGREQVVLPGEGGRPDLADPVREELAIAMRETPQAMAGRIERARRQRRHPSVTDLAANGHSALRGITAVLGDVAELDPADADTVLDWLVDRVHDRFRSGRHPWTPPELRRAVRRQILKSTSHRKAAAKNRADRRVELWDGPPGVAVLSAVLPEEVAHRVHRRLTAMGKGLPDDRPLDAKRADILADLLLGGAALDGAPGAAGEVAVIVSLTSLLGADEPGELAGLGPIPAEVARELAADASWRAWLTDAKGSVVAMGSRTYRPSPAVARIVRARHPYCRMPGCRTRAEHCDLDHEVPWPAGPTEVANLGPLCRRHHNQKTHLGWRVDSNEQRIRWRSPLGSQPERDPIRRPE